MTKPKSCISEAQKYQGALYRPEKEKKNKQNNSREIVPHKAYVEDAYDEGYNSHITIVDPPMPEAPSPPSAAPEFRMSADPPNVFDFLVESETPNASHFELMAPEPMPMIEDVPEEPQSRDLVRVRFEENNDSVSNFIEYGNGPVTTGYATPAPKAERERKKEKKDRDLHKEEKKDKKRKRLHVETHDLNPRSDELMTDAPPVLHSGLTGGLNRLLSRPSVFPPSPDYSGDAGEPSPGSPLKKTKHSTKRGRSISNNLMSLISNPLGSSREQSREQSREHSEDRPKRKHRRHRESSERPSRKMIEYVPLNSDGAVQVQEDAQNQMVVYQPRGEMLLGFINKGPESERGLSMNKALKRYHRERAAMGSTLSRAEEEKELWKSLRMKRNEVGEIVLFL